MKSLIKILFAVAALTVSTFAQAPLQYRVDTINDLLNITLYGTDAKVTAWVGGLSSRDDGHGGVFFFDGASSASTNVYAIYKGKNNTAGRWFKLPTSVANQASPATYTDSSTYAWTLLSANATPELGIGSTASSVFLQSWNSEPLHINDTGGNNVVIHGQGTGSLIVGNTLVVTNATTLQSTLAVTGNSTLTGTLALGGGTALKAIYSAVAQIDFPSISANGVTNMTLTVTGAGTNSTVNVSVDDGAGTAGIIFNGYVSATNTVTIRAANPTLNAIDPAATVSYRATVFQY